MCIYWLFSSTNELICESYIQTLVVFVGICIFHTNMFVYFLYLLHVSCICILSLFSLIPCYGLKPPSSVGHTCTNNTYTICIGLTWSAPQRMYYLFKSASIVFSICTQCTQYTRAMEGKVINSGLL